MISKTWLTHSKNWMTETGYSDGLQATGCGLQVRHSEPESRSLSPEPLVHGLNVRARRPSKQGFPVVLAADRTLMARYETLFDGMIGATQTTRTPALLMKHFLAPRVRPEGCAAIRARQAPLGLRRIEAALAAHGWDREDVAVVGPEDLGRAIGPDTRVIGLSSGDPLGRGMMSTTMAGIAGGQMYTTVWFQGLTERVSRIRARAPRARLVMGGPGAWQLVTDDEARRALGVDHVVTGYCEGNVADVFCGIADGDSLPAVVQGIGVRAEQVPRILGPTVLGSVEISRGCGMGCRFCTIGRVPMGHVPAETILADVDTNVAAGVSSVSLITEDVFRYGAIGGRASPGALVELLRRIRQTPGLALVQTDHANVNSVAQFSDAELREVRRFLADGGEDEYVWLNLGVETASGELLAANGGRGKMNPYAPDEWGEVCLDQVRRRVRAGFLPLVSLIMGLPGETPDDAERTARWVAQLRHERAAIFPLFHAPVDGKSRAFGVADMTAAHWRLFRECYDLNFKWIPRLCWRNQSRAGVSLWRRVALQALGRMQTVWWKGLFVWRSGGLGGKEGSGLRVQGSGLRAQDG